MNKTKQKLKDKEKVYLPKKTCIYCTFVSFGKYHVECYRVMIYLSTSGFTEQEKREIVKKLTVQREKTLKDWENRRLKY